MKKIKILKIFIVVFIIIVTILSIVKIVLIDSNRREKLLVDYSDVIAVGTFVEGENRTLIGTAPTFKNPIIPVGFKAVNDGASWEISEDYIIGWNDGLVIEDEKGSQFVWVPVDGVNVKYKKWCFDSLHYGPTYYETPGEDTSSGIDEMHQIEKYQGFWIARYEAGRSDIDYATPETNDVSTGVELLIKKGAQVWNYISYVNAKSLAEGYVNNEHVKSSLLTGKQWDTTMRWIGNSGYNITKDSIDWGFHYNTELTGYGRYTYDSNYIGQNWQVGEYCEDGERVFFIGTGCYEVSQAKNIYDLAGGVREWTTEEYRDERVYFHVSRGGSAHSYSYELPASYRSCNKETYTTSLLGFRVALYVE